MDVEMDSLKYMLSHYVFLFYFFISETSVLKEVL